MVSFLSHVFSQTLKAPAIFVAATAVLSTAIAAFADYCCVTYDPDDGTSIIHSCPYPDYNCCFCDLEFGQDCRWCSPDEICRGVYRVQGRQIGVECVRRPNS